jgi:4-amino-4-deoxy-L-arabinose transferase-like glycosyltransferase
LARKYQIFILLALSLALRIYGLRAPIIGVHSWRQADTAAMARNFYENGYRFSYPQIDWGGDSKGYVEAEFPLYPFVVALFYKISGVFEFYGRFLSVICYLMGTYFLYLLVKKLIDSSTALWSCIFFSFLPLNLFYSRTFMPESALIMSSVLGVYFFYQWLTLEKLRYFVLSFGFIALACLLKITALYLGLPLLYLSWLRFGSRLFSRWSLWLYALLALAPVILWYYHAHQIFLQSGLTFGIWQYGADKWGNWELPLTLRFWDRIVFRSLAERFFTWVGFLIFLVGLFMKRRTREEKLFDFWLGALIVFFIIVAKGNYVHEYYQLPFLIPASVFMGKVYARYFNLNIFKNRRSFLLIICLVAVMVLGATRYHSYMRKEDPPSSETFQLAEMVKQKTAEHDLIIAVDGNDPTLLYLSHRKGWHALPDQLNQSFLSERIKRGAKYLVGDHKSFEEKSAQQELKSVLSDNYQVLFDDGRSFIIKLSDQ